MSKRDAAGLTAAGAMVGGGAALFYVACAPGVIERGVTFYLFNGGLITAGLILFFQLALRLRRTPRRGRPLAACLYAGSGLSGAAVMLAATPGLLPETPPESLIRCAILLTVGYAIVVALAFERPARDVPARDRKAA